MCVSTVEGSTDDYQSMTIEKVSEEEHSQVEVLKSGRQTVFEERITRVEETEREVIEEKSIREFVCSFRLRCVFRNPYVVRITKNAHVQLRATSVRLNGKASRMFYITSRTFVFIVTSQGIVFECFCFFCV